VESAESPSTDRGGDPPDASQLQAVLAEALGDAAVPHAHDAAQAESVLPAETQAPDEKIEPLAAAFAHVEAVHDETAHNEAAHVEAALGDATAHALAGAPYGGAAQDEIHELIEALEPHDAGAWDSIAAPREEAVHESAAAIASADAGAEKALHIEDLVPAEVIGADPWGSGFEEAIPPAANAAPASAPEASWGAELGGDNIDWAPAWDDAKGPAKVATPAAPTWSEPAPATPALATQEEWNDSAAWDAQTVHAASLPAILSRAAKNDDWSEPEPEADWPAASSSSSSPAQAMPVDDSPFAPLAPGASLSGDDEPGLAGEEDGLVELNPADLEPLPPEEHETLFPLEEIAPPAGSKPLASHPLALPGEHRVAVQTRGGQTRRGLLRNADLTAAHLTLHASSGGAEPERIASNDVKAVFFMLAPGERGHRGDGGVTGTLSV